MKETTYLEKTKNDALEMVQLLNNIPESKKESVLMLVRGFKLGIESEERTAVPG